MLFNSRIIKVAIVTLIWGSPVILKAAPIEECIKQIESHCGPFRGGDALMKCGWVVRDSSSSPCQSLIDFRYRARVYEDKHDGKLSHSFHTEFINLFGAASEKDYENLIQPK